MTAIAKSIFRNHPFFKYSGYQPWGSDWRTFYVCYPRSADILWRELKDDEGRHVNTKGERSND